MWFRLHLYTSLGEGARGRPALDQPLRLGGPVEVRKSARGPTAQVNLTGFLIWASSYQPQVVLVGVISHAPYREGFDTSAARAAAVVGQGWLVSRGYAVLLPNVSFSTK